MKTFKEYINEKKYKLIDWSGKPVSYIDYHGDELEVKEVLKDSIIVMMPNGEEEEILFDEAKEQDESLKEIK